MIRNYLKIAFRNLTKYKVISFINLFGLTVGITCCLLILSYIRHEISYDRYNSKADRIYRVTRSFNNREGIVSLHLAAVAPPFGPLLQNEFPDIEKTTRILPIGDHTTRYNEKIFNEKNIMFADENLFSIFDVPLLKGNPQTALTDPRSAIMTAEVAKKYFGDQDPIGKIIRMDNQFDIRVSGIFKPFPDASHLHPQLLLSFNTLKDSAIYGEKKLQTQFGNNAFFTYLLLPAHYPAANIEARFPAFLDKYMHEPGDVPGNGPSQYTKLHLQKLTDIHLTSHLDSEIEENGDVHRVYIFGAIALFILIIACINYMNLATARSALRAREIGIRKVAGAQRREIILQFLSESVLITALATGLAILLAWLTLPLLNTVTGLSLHLGTVLTTPVILLLALTPFLVGLLSGIYPALVMSSFQPSKVLKGLFKAGNGSISFRKALVVAQFAISIVLIICTAIVFQQLRYIQKASLGFSKDHIVTLNYDNGLDNIYDAFRADLKRDPLLLDVARSSRIPSDRLLDEDGASIQRGDTLAPVSADLKVLAIDYDFIPAYGIHMAAGRNFSRDYGTDTTNFILNVSATRALGLHNPEEALGKNFQYGSQKGKIIGITQDFHFESMHQQIQSMVFMMPPAYMQRRGLNFVAVKITGTDVPAALSHLESTWKKYLPQTPFEYTFLDLRFDQLYRSEQRQSALFTSFSVIAIFIACLGLLGLSAFAITQRIKEIGVRKVLGATTGSIVTLLSTDFLKLTLLAAIIAFPVAWYAMDHWLMDFAYRISIQWWIFLAAGILASSVALLTIGFQAVRAALANPVKNLRSE